MLPRHYLFTIWLTRTSMSNKNMILSLAFCLCMWLLPGSSAFAQEDMWQKLADLTWKHFYDETLGFDVSQPVFGEELKKLDGKQITINGYVLPVDLEGDNMIISAFPFASCFFCGNAGPETVMQLDIAKNMRLVDKKITVRGTLQLNDQDFLSLVYSLKDAEVTAEN